MSLMIFVIGVLVFLVTVYGTVVGGGLLLTGRQLDEDPELELDEPQPKDAATGFGRARALVRSKF